MFYSGRYVEKKYEFLVILRQYYLVIGIDCVLIDSDPDPRFWFVCFTIGKMINFV